jgi:ABC-type bacteriocin/lantibiotic exporter with double-glycine peptidase domain
MTHDNSQHLSPFKRLLKLLSNERKDIGYIYFFAVVVGLISLVLPLGVQAIFGLVSSGSIFSSVYVLMALVILGLIGSGVMQVIQVTLVETLQRRIFAKAAFEFTYRLPRIQSEALRDVNAVELMNRFFDVLTIQKSLPKFLIDITAAVLQIVFGLLLLSFYHPFFIAFTFVVVLVFIVVIRLSGRKGLETSIYESKYKYRIVAWLEDIARTVYAFKMAGDSNLPLHKMDTLVENYLHYRHDHFRILKGFYYYALAFKILVIGGLLVLGTYLLINRQISLGQFVASEIVIVLLTAAVEKLFLSIDIIFDLLTAVDKLGYVSDLPLEKKGAFEFTPKTPNGLSISLKNVSYKYPDVSKNILSNLTFDIKSGERVCITGQNGSGKQTLFKVLTGIVENYEGSVFLDGLSLRDVNKSQLRAKIAVNFPNQEIFDGTILENLTMGQPNVSLTTIQKVLDELRISDEIALQSNGLNTYLISGGQHFSRSFLRKLAIARSIIAQPQLLLFTDMLQNIEAKERLRISQLLTDTKNNWTLVAISNDPAFMAACDRVIVLDNGRVVADGDYKSVLKTIC